jgi:hypothetical protein
MDTDKLPRPRTTGPPTTDRKADILKSWNERHPLFRGVPADLSERSLAIHHEFLDPHKLDRLNVWAE